MVYRPPRRKHARRCADAILLTSLRQPLYRWLTAMHARPINVFVVEGSLLILESLVATLEEMAPVSIVGSAQSESSALEQLQQLDGQLDLAVVDIFLQSGSGLGVLRRIAQQGLKAKWIVPSNYATAEICAARPCTGRRLRVRQIPGHDAIHVAP